GRLRDQKAVISVAHPFDRLRQGAWREQDLERIIDQVDAIEVFNSRCIFPQDNVKAMAFAQKHHVPGTAGSDAHTPVEYGQAKLRMQPFEGAPDFLAALGSAQVVEGLSPVYVHLGSSIGKWSRKLRLRPRVWAGG